MVRRGKVGISIFPHPPYACFARTNEAGNNRISWSEGYRLGSQPFRTHPTFVFAPTEVRYVIVGLDVLIARASCMCVCYWEFAGILNFFYFLAHSSYCFRETREEQQNSYFLVIRPCRRCKELTLAPSTRDDIYSAEPTPSLKPRRHANKGSSTSRRTSISLAFPKLTKHAHKSRHAEIFQLLSPLITVSTSCSNILLYASNPVPAGTHLPHR